MITLKEVRKIVDEIKATGSNDSEKSFSLETDLYTEVLKTILEDKEVPLRIRSLVKLTLKTQEVDFNRYCS